MTTPTFSSRRSLMIACVALGLLLAAPMAQAQGGQTELRSTADYNYGQSINFHLSAANVGEIEAITLYIRLGVSPDSFAVDVPIDPGPNIELSYALDLTQTRLPPFGSITYWWELERTAGSPLRVPEQIISYVDDRFNWRQLVTTDDQGGGSVRIHWTGDDELLGEQARDITFELLPELGELLSIEQILPFDIYIYPSTADLGAALRLAGRDYQPGQTYPDLGVVLLTVLNPQTAEEELRAGLSLGLTDLLLYQGLNQYAFNVPPWLRRGLAGAAQGSSDIVQSDVLRSAIADGTTMAVADLCAGMPVEDDLAIAQSESLVNHIIATNDDAAVRDLVLAFAEGQDCATALAQTLQLTPQQLETAWLRANSGNQSSQDVAEIAVWLVLVLAGFGLAGLLLIRPRHS